MKRGRGVGREMQWRFLEELEGEVRDRYEQDILHVYMKLSKNKLHDVFSVL